MSNYSFKKEKNTIEFWTDDKELSLRVEQNIQDIIAAINYRRHIYRTDRFIESEEE